MIATSPLLSSHMSGQVRSLLVLPSSSADLPKRRVKAAVGSASQFLGMSNSSVTSRRATVWMTPDVGGPRAVRPSFDHNRITITRGKRGSADTYAKTMLALPTTFSSLVAQSVQSSAIPCASDLLTIVYGLWGDTQRP